MSDLASTRETEPSCQDEAFVIHLLALHDARQTGVLTVRAEGVTTDIYLREGTPVFADRNTLAGSLGRGLLVDGMLNEAQYEAVIGQMTQALFESEQMRFAEVAIALGYLSHEEANARLERHVREAVIACMAPQKPHVTFRASAEAIAPVANYPCPVQPLVMAGIKRYYDSSRTQAVWQPDARAFASLKSSPAETASLYALQPGERRYIGNIDGEHRIEELIHTGFLDVLHAGQVIAGLLLTDGMHLLRHPLAVPSDVPTVQAQVLESDSARRRKSSPLLRAVQMSTVAASAPAVEASALPKTASELEPAATGERAVDGVTVSPVQRRIKAERLFVQGKRLYRSGNLPRAVRIFGMAARLDPDAVEYALHEQWIQFLLEPPARPDDTLASLNALALETIRLDKMAAFAYYVHGRVAQARGNAETARQSLKTAVRLDPSNVEAKRFLRVVAKRP